jgi:hypothetical protein
VAKHREASLSVGFSTDSTKQIASVVGTGARSPPFDKKYGKGMAAKILGGGATVASSAP